MRGKPQSIISSIQKRGMRNSYYSTGNDTSSLGKSAGKSMKLAGDTLISLDKDYD